MRRKSVQRGRNAKHSGASNEDPVQGEDDAKDFVADAPEKLATNVVNAIDVRVCQFEDANDIVGPARHG